jgi:sugar phosphate isomerase/epimerase
MVPIALQLYSVRDDAAQDLFGVIEKVAKMGYQGVEFAGFHGKSAAEIRKCLDDNGLVCCGTHTMMTALDPENLEETLDFHTTIGCPNMVIPWIPEEKRNTPEACLATAALLTGYADAIRSRGFRTGFHAHDGDMKPLEGGKPAWYILGENTPADFILQYDTANGMHGGADPVQPILDFPGRGITVHLKDYKEGEWPVVGEGDVPFERVFAACEPGAGTEWYVVEHESEVGLTPLEAVARCLDNLRAMGKA